MVSGNFESLTGNKRFSDRVLAEFCRQMTAMTGAGITVARTLEIMADDETNRRQERKIYRKLHQRIWQGESLSGAMKGCGSVFPPLLIFMFRAAEAGGNLPEVSEKMADYYERQHKRSIKLKNAVLYPRILLVMLVVVTVFMLLWVLPKFEGLFAGMEKLPLSTRILFGTGNFVQSNWFILPAAAAAAVMLVWIAGHIRPVRRMMAGCKVHFPVLGKLYRTIYTARFAGTLSFLYASGVPMMQALKYAGNTVGNEWITGQFTDLLEAVREGETLSDALERIDGFHKKLASAVRVGEESGSLDRMLLSMADTLDYEAEMAADRMIAMLEPLMIILLGGMVGFVMLAVLQPIYSSYEMLGI